MPNRIIKESICTSDSIDALTWFEEVLYYRLIVNCDDYGRFDGRTAVIKNRLFPLKDNVTAKSVEQSINKMVTCGLVTLYEFEGKPYLQLPSWKKHQNVRAKKSKYPPYDSDLNTDDFKCMQMYANVPVIQSNPNTNPNPNTRDNAHTHEKFVKPTVEEVKAYCTERKNNVDAEHFVDYYESNGWVVGKTRMKDWRATVRSWEKNGYNKPSATKAGTKAATSFDVDEAVKKAMERTYAK